MLINREQTFSMGTKKNSKVPSSEFTTSMVTGIITQLVNMIWKTEFIERLFLCLKLNSGSMNIM